MHTTEIVIREVQGNRSFKVRQLLAESIRKPRKAPKLCSHGQVLPLHVTSRDVIFVRPSVYDFGYNLRDSWWGIPRVGAIVLSVIPEQFHKLREVGLSREDTLNRAVEVIARKRNVRSANTSGRFAS
jgi:hypothetical protein